MEGYIRMGTGGTTTGLGLWPSGLSWQGGFTLMELVIVLIIMGMLGVTAMVMWPTASINVAGQKDLVLQDIRYTQSIAMARATSGQRSRITFGGSSYSIADTSGNTVKTVSLFSGILFANNNFTGGYLAFDGLGRPYNGTTLMTSTITVDVTGGAEAMSITVWDNTGAAQ